MYNSSTVLKGGAIIGICAKDRMGGRGAYADGEENGLKSL